MWGGILVLIFAILEVRLDRRDARARGDPEPRRSFMAARGRSPGSSWSSSKDIGARGGNRRQDRDENRGGDRGGDRGVRRDVLLRILESDNLRIRILHLCWIFVLIFAILRVHLDRHDPAARGSRDRDDFYERLAVLES